MEGGLAARVTDLERLKFGDIRQKAIVRSRAENRETRGLYIAQHNPPYVSDTIARHLSQPKNQEFL